MVPAPPKKETMINAYAKIDNGITYLYFVEIKYFFVFSLLLRAKHDKLLDKV